MTILGNTVHLHYPIFGSHKIYIAGYTQNNKHKQWSTEFVFKCNSEEECQLWCDLNGVTITDPSEVFRIYKEKNLDNIEVSHETE